MLARVQATKFSFWSVYNNPLPPIHRTLPRASTVLGITPAWTQVNLQSSAIQSCPGANSHSRDITLRSHQQSNIPDFTRRPSVTGAEIFTCNHASSPSHVEDVSAQGGQLHNSLHTISTITPAITTIITNSYMKIVQLRKSRERPIHLKAYSSVQIDLLQREKDIFPSSPNQKKYEDILVIPVNRRIIMNFSPSRDFFNFSFYLKNHVSICSLCCVY